MSAWPQFRGHGASVMVAEDGSGVGSAVVGSMVVGAAVVGAVGSEVVGSEVDGSEVTVGSCDGV